MKKSKGMNNKGFSLVELIIVMAILAILAGVLAPQLIKYIDSSRRSSDVQNGQAIATAVNIALAHEAAYEEAVPADASTEPYLLGDIYNPAVTTNEFFEKVKENLGATSAPTPKFKGASDFVDFAILITKDASGNVSFVICPADSNGASTDPGNQLYPTVGANYLE